MAKQHEIVILGAHHAGVAVAHYLLRHVAPQLAKLTSTTFHVTIVAPNTEFFHNVPSPRAIPGGIPLEKIFLPLEDGFKEYKPESYSFVIGKAVGLNPDEKAVTVQLNDTKAEKVFNYSTLVLATGSTAKSPLWWMNDSVDVVKNAFEEVQASLEKGDTILISGGGAVGVETAAEIGHHYHEKKVTLLSGGERLLLRHPSGNSTSAESKLKALGVEIIHNVRSTTSRKLEDGKTEVMLSDGTTRRVDVFIDATGPTPNSSFLPPVWLNSAGKVNCNDETFRVEGAPNVYVCGDLASCSDGGIMTVVFGTSVVGSSIAVDLAKEYGVASPLQQKKFKPMKNTQFVTIGPNAGVGQIMGWRVPSIIVWLIKSRDMFLPSGPKAVCGADYIKP